MESKQPETQATKEKPSVSLTSSDPKKSKRRKRLILSSQLFQVDKDLKVQKHLCKRNLERMYLKKIRVHQRNFVRVNLTFKTNLMTHMLGLCQVNFPQSIKRISGIKRKREQTKLDQTLRTLKNWLIEYSQILTIFR